MPSSVLDGEELLKALRVALPYSSSCFTRLHLARCHCRKKNGRESMTSP